MIRDPNKEAELAQFEARFGKDAVNHMIDEGVKMLKFLETEVEINPDEVVVTAEAVPEKVLRDPSSQVILRFRALYPRFDNLTGKRKPPTILIWGEVPPTVQKRSIWKDAPK